MVKNNRINILSAILIYAVLVIAILVIKGEYYQSSPESTENLEETYNYEEEFNKYKEEFKEKYDIDLYLYYGGEIDYTENESYKKVELDEGVIECVKEMRDTLSKYPERMLKNEIKYNYEVNIMKQGMDIYLVRDMYSEGDKSIGLTIHRNPYKDIMLLDVEGNDIGAILSHEIFHIIEKKGISEMTLYFNEKFSTKRWRSYNPEAFIYSEKHFTDLRKYLKGEPQDIYFVTSYSKTNRVEDMAEIFAAMMSYEEDNIPDSFYSPHVINKMRFISEFLEENYESATEDAYWNRWLNSLEEGAN